MKRVAKRGSGGGGRGVSGGMNSSSSVSGASSNLAMNAPELPTASGSPSCPLSTTDLQILTLFHSEKTYFQYPQHYNKI